MTEVLEKKKFLKQLNKVWASISLFINIKAPIEIAITIAA